MKPPMPDYFSTLMAITNDQLYDTNNVSAREQREALVNHFFSKLGWDFKKAICDVTELHEMMREIRERFPEKSEEDVIEGAHQVVTALRICEEHKRSLG